MIRAPPRAVPSHLPLLIHVQQSEVIRLWNLKLFDLGVCFLFSSLWPEEVLVNAQHRDDGQDLGRTVEVRARDEHLRQGGVQRELDHLATEWRESPGVVQRTQDPQLVHRVEDVVLWRRVHEVKVEKVVDAE